jgi:Uma2 family endonuclease
MSTISETVLLPRTALPVEWSLADVQRHVGGVPIERIRSYPPPGMATEEDALKVHDHEDRLCELVDGILVEKTMGYYEAFLAGVLLQWINNFFDKQPLGFAMAPDGPLRILPNRVRLPDISVILWDRIPDRRLPRGAVLRLAPDLAVEIWSAGNTAGEMQMKLDEYRRAGVRLVWYIDPAARTATIHTPDGRSQTLDENGVLDGSDVLPGFSFALRELLDRFPRE